MYLPGLSFEFMLFFPEMAGTIGALNDSSSIKLNLSDGLELLVSFAAVVLHHAGNLRNEHPESIEGCRAFVVFSYQSFDFHLSASC